MSKIIGIDLGTTNSVAAVMEGGQPTVIRTAEGGNLAPSVVAFSKTGERLVGQTAKRQAVVNPENTVYSIKRFIGRRISEVEAERKMVSYTVVAGPSEEVLVKLPGPSKNYTPQEISAMILAKLKADAESYLGEPVTRAVITVPAYFNDSQRQATKDAGKIAGLEVVRIINEPTAAALAYGLDKKENETILVFDLGGGTFDVSLLEVGEGVVEVRATHGDTHLGGDDWDQAILNWVAGEFQHEHGIDLRLDRQALQRLREAAEKAKIELSTVNETEINLPFVTADAHGPKHLQRKLSRAKLEQLTEALVARLRGPIEAVLKDGAIQAGDVHEVVLVGGATRMPMVQDLVRSLTGKEPHKGVNPDEVVAVGAAIQGGVLAGEVKDVLLLDVTPLSLGVETLGGVRTALIPRNTTIPVKKGEVFSTAEDGQTAVDIHVLQGERSMAADNTTLGRFRLEGLPAAPRGTPQIEVSFDIDANGILNVAARDQATGKEQRVTITATTHLTENDIQRMVEEAKQHSADDSRLRDLVEARNRADSLVYGTQKALRELGDRVPAADRQHIEAKVAELRQAMNSDDAARIQRLAAEVEQASHALSQQIGAQPTGSPAQGPSDGEIPGRPGGEGEVIEGEFREA